MNTTKRIGKIADIKIGYGGYQDVCFGISFTFESKKDCWGCGDFWGVWGPSISTKHAEWTEKERQADLARHFWRLAKLMEEAGVSSADKLVGIPVEVEFDMCRLKSWRILTEAL